MMQQQCSSRPSRISPYLAAHINSRFNIGVPNITSPQLDVNSAGVIYVKNNKNYPGKTISFSNSTSDSASQLDISRRVIKINTAILVIKTCFDRGYSFNVFRDKKGNIYYARDGFILDKNRKPILLVVYTLGGDLMARFQILVPPRIFSSTGLVEKYIAKTLLPYFYSIKTIPFSNTRAPITVGITDAIDDYIIAPHYTNSHYQEEISKLLKENSSIIADSLCRL